MIELHTGLPGAGKTLRAIERGIELKAQGRRVYYLDINELDETATGFEPFPGRLEDWATILQKGDVLIVDEVQRFLPAIVRRDGAPAWIEALTRNRHLGVDLIFITQHPKLLDSFVRRLVNKHEHVLNVFGRQEANLYTWVQVCEEPESKSQRNMADVRRWKYPDALFGLYKSAELHTRKAHQPRMVKIGKFALIAGVLFALLAIGLLWRMYHSPKAEGARSAPPQSTSSSLLSPRVGHSDAGDERPELTPSQWLHRNIPRVPGMPWSAPLFDDRKPTSEPDIYCMVAVDEHKCICHSEQGTRLQIPYDQCTIIATVGVYNPYRAPASKLGRDLLQERQQLQADVRASGERLDGARASRPATPRRQ